MSQDKSEKKMLLWGVGTAGEGFVSIISGTYLSLFLTDVVGMPVAMSGTVLMITSTAAFIIASCAGAAIATLKPMRWGRLRSWLLVAPPFAAIFYVLHFLPFGSSMTAKAVQITICYVLASTCFNLAYTSNMSLTNVIAKDQAQRNSFNSQRMMGSNIGRLMGNYLTPVIVAALAVHLTEQKSYPILIAIAGCFFVITELIQFFLAKGREDEFLASNNLKDDSLKFKDIIDILKTNGQLLVTMIIDLTSNVASIALPSMAVYYYRNVLERPDMVKTHMLCVGLAGFAGAFCVRLIGSKVKKYKSYLLVVYLIISALLFGTKLIQGNATAFLCMNICVHFLTGTTTPFEMNLYQDNVIYSEYKTGVNANALIMGLSELPVKIAGVLKSVLLTLALTTSGYVAGVAPTVELKNALANAYAIIPGCIPILGFVLLLFFYKLTPEKIAQYKEEIKNRAN